MHCIEHSHRIRPQHVHIIFVQHIETTIKLSIFFNKVGPMILFSPKYLIDTGTPHQTSIEYICHYIRSLEILPYILHRFRTLLSV